MAKTERNDPCPCGSGKKFKECCLDRIEAGEAVAAARPPVASFAELEAELADLDDLSNSVIDLLNAKRLAEAEAACRKLLELYPDQVDGLERSALVCEAQGRNAEAARYYRQAAAFMGEDGGFDPESIEEALSSARRLESEASGGT